MTRTTWAITGLLLLAVVGVGVGLRLAGSRPRFVPAADLLEELATAELPEDAPEAGWPQWRGPRRDGDAAGVLSRDWSGLKPRWKVAGGDGYSSFAARGGLAWTMAEQDGEEVVLCLDLRNGEERWRYAYRPAASFQYGGPRATPAVDGDDLLTLSSDGRLLCLDAATGQEKWKSALSAAAPRWGFASSPLVEGGLVYVETAAFDLETGAKRWEKTEPVGYSSPMMATVGGVRQVLCFTGTHLLGLRAGDGEELWRFAWETPFKVNAATPLVVPTAKGEVIYVFVSSGYEKGSALVRVAKAGSHFEARAVYETNELCCHFASPVRHGEYVYGLDEARDLTCLELRTGRVMWRQRGFRKGSLIRVGDLLVVLGENGNLSLAEASPEGYEEVTKAKPFRDRCWAAPALAGGLLLVRDRKTIQAFGVGD